MTNDLPNITKVAAALSDHSKMLILDSLMDKRGHTLLEIAQTANVKPPTASYHLQSFISFGWVVMRKAGRFHYFFLIDSEVAKLIEEFSPIAPYKPTTSRKEAIKVNKMAEFRSCYDHMAGKIGVLITDLLVKNKFINENGDSYEVTQKGIPFFKTILYIDLQKTYQKKRQFAPKCLDWSERRYHLGGALGNDVFNAFQNQDFVARDATMKRALVLTMEGKNFIESFKI